MMRPLINTFYFLASSALVLVFCELFVRYAKISEVSMYEFYNDIGKAPGKPKHYLYFSEGMGIATFNKLRLKGDDISLKKPENTIRIALIGDSYIQAIHVFERDDFGNIAQKILNHRFKNLNFEILNFGRDNFCLGNMYAYDKLFAENFDPDYTFYFLSNDDFDNDYTITPLLPITKLKHDTLTISIDKKESDLKTYQYTKVLTQNSVLINIINSCRKKINNGATPSILFDKLYTVFNSDNNNIKPYKYYHPDSLTNTILTHLNPNTIIVNRDIGELAKGFDIFCASNDLVYYDLSNTLDSLRLSETKLNYWISTNKYGHWNHQSHMVIGQMLANYVTTLVNKKDSDD